VVNDLHGCYAVVQIFGDGDREILDPPVAAAAVAPRAAGYEVPGLIPAAVRVRGDMVQGERGAVFDRCATVDAGETIAQVDR